MTEKRKFFIVDEDVKPTWKSGPLFTDPDLAVSDPVIVESAKIQFVEPEPLYVYDVAVLDLRYGGVRAVHFGTFSSKEKADAALRSDGWILDEDNDFWTHPVEGIEARTEAVRLDFALRSFSGAGFEEGQ